MSFLTSYRPNFCCECGQKIVRLRWFLWTSRKFCDQCLRALVKSHWVRPSVTLLVLFLFGVVIGRGCRRAPPPLIIERTATPAAAQASSSVGAPPPMPALEQVYLCGARTKKGTPCSRRVHGPVRCWQHKGAKAMLPPEKLVVQE
ncbi:MAG TPA: hypothetical protein VFT02_07245 [Pyrinomonadaceae bacterium]|nr:hypothetical protein [Pyrinomonadaceae bacterium]